MLVHAVAGVPWLRSGLSGNTVPTWRHGANTSTTCVQAESWACSEFSRLESAPSGGVSIGALCDACLPVEVQTHVEHFGSEALPARSASL